MTNFNEFMGNWQSAWRKGQKINQDQGTQNNRKRTWILLRSNWEDGLWDDLRTDSGDSDIQIAPYLKREMIQRHTGSHNLKSSWMQCANLYFPFRRDMGLMTTES